MNHDESPLPATGDLARGLDRVLVPHGERLTVRCLTDASALAEELEVQVEHLRRERERSGFLFDAAPFACLATDADGRIVEANRAAAELLGVPPARLAGQRIGRFLGAEHRRPLPARLAALRPGEADRWRAALTRGSAPVQLHCRMAEHAPAAACLLWMVTPG
ncbi:MAG TPA: PAS domain-containing protein [Burkholderiales bacterium]|nr:PAS domain-containing protein [Burkholderiales bacterium]